MKNIFIRTSAWTIAVLLLAGISSFIICALYASKEDYLQKQEETYPIIPVTVMVQGVTGETGSVSSITPWTIDLFTGKNPVEIIDRSSGSSITTQVSLSEYLKEVQIKMSYRIEQLNGSPLYRRPGENYPDLIGITSIPSDERLLPENGCEIAWYNGYNESIFGGEELVCLVPEGKLEAYDNGNGEAVLYFYYAWGRIENGTYVEVSRKEYECTLKIVGTYTAGDEINIYCPFSIIEQVYAGLEERPKPDSISATLTDNLLLNEFCEKASFFYSNLSENPQNFPDGISVSNRSKSYTFNNYLNALDIDNGDLLDYMSDFEEKNIKVSRIIMVLIVVLSATSGGLTLVRMMYCQRHGFVLLCINGKLTLKEYFVFVFKQIVLVVVGIALGGVCYLWKPIDKLLLFAIVNFVAVVIVAMLFFVIQLVSKTEKY